MSKVVSNLLSICFLLVNIHADMFSQCNYFAHAIFTAKDSLRGALRPERTCYDVKFYDIHLALNLSDSTINGYNDIHFELNNQQSTSLQLDLFSNLTIDKVEYKNEKLNYVRVGDAFFVEIVPMMHEAKDGAIRVSYHGKPIIAKNAPWDGGFVWANQNGNPWVGLACEGIGASCWLPIKDHLSDEPDSVSLRLTIPDSLTCVSNGTLKDELLLPNHQKTFHWFVSYPINTYNITINVGKYAHFSDTYVASDKSSLQLDYYVLPDNLDKAKNHFRQVEKVLSCYEKYFGKYPFWRDGYALVETPYLGMEHQGAIAYGNGYQRGYLGVRIPDDMDFDFIIVHETGHEYFGNALSCKDHAEMWLHEAFTTYMESLFVEYTMSKDDAIRYINFQRQFIANKTPMLAPLNVNFNNWEDSDIYYKGTLMLNTLRHIIDNDDKWFDLLKSFYNHYAIGFATTQDFVMFAQKYTSVDLSKFFDQYLTCTQIPTLEYQIETKRRETTLKYKWVNVLPDFAMPFDIKIKGKKERIFPTTNYQTLSVRKANETDFEFLKDHFFINLSQIQ